MLMDIDTENNLQKSSNIYLNRLVLTFISFYVFFFMNSKLRHLKMSSYSTSWTDMAVSALLA